MTRKNLIEALKDEPIIQNALKNAWNPKVKCEEIKEPKENPSLQNREKEKIFCKENNREERHLKTEQKKNVECAAKHGKNQQVFKDILAVQNVIMSIINLWKGH